MIDQTRVLHVEDAKDARAIIARYLGAVSTRQFQIACVDGESSAIEQFKREPFDLAIVDYELTEGNGLSCVGKLRRLDALLPIIAISGRASEDVVGELLRVGVDDYFDKSRLRREEFTRAVLAALERCEHWKKCRRGVLAEGNALERQMESLSQQVKKFAEQNLAPQIAEVVRTVRAGSTDPESFKQICRDVFQDTSPSYLWEPLCGEIERQSLEAAR